MHGTRTAILQDIESNIKNVNDLSVIWIRGSPGVGKSALAASMAARLRKLDRHLISFRFDHTQSAIITTDALWRAIALDLARLFPSVRQHIHNLVRGNRMPDPSDIDDRFRTLIETPLSTLNDVPPEKLPIIVIDALDECGGLRHDSSGRDDFESLMHTLKRWVQVDHLKKLKLIITSRPENRITKIFPKSISVHVNIPSGSDVKLGDSVSNDIHAFLKSRLNDMEMKPAWITKALDFLVPGAAGIFIWATTVANFLERDPEGRFAMLKKGDGKGLKSLYSLYSTIVKASFGYDLEVEEIRAVVSVIGAMIFARQPLDDNALIMLPEVKIPGSDADRLGLIRKGLVSVIDSGPILRFHHRSFEDFLLSPSFLQEHPELLAIQDHVHQERQLTVLSLKTLVSSKLHFNMCSLESSFVFNKNIQAAAKTTIPPLVSYSCQYWADHLIFTPSDEMLVDAVKFVMYEKLLFWMEVMSLLGKAYEVALILKRALAWKVCLQFICHNTSLMLVGQTLNPGHELTLFIHDALRFISAFIIPISQCAPLIYVSALSFTPDQSLITKKFCSRFPNTIVVTEGKPSQWPMVLFTAEHHGDGVHPVFFSTNESIFASISGYCNKTICVCDAETGHCISGPFQLPYDAHIYNACFSPDMKHILLQFKSDAVVLDIVTGEEQFWIKGLDFVFIHHDGRIVFIDEIDEDGNFIAWGEEQGGRPTHIPVKSWDANNGFEVDGFEVDGVACTRFSPDGRFLAVGRKSESVIELWSLEDGKDPRQFLYPPGNNLSSLHFSPTSDSLMAVFMEKPSHIYLWRLDTQEMASFSHDFTHAPHVIHLPLTNYLVIRRYNTLEIWDVSVTGSKLIWKTTEAPTHIWSTCPSRDGHRLLVGYDDGKVKMWDLDLENLAINQADTMDTQDDTDLRQVILISHSGKMVATEAKRSRSIDFLDTTTGEVISHMNFANHTGIVFSPEEDQAVFWSKSLITICDIMHPDNRVSFDLWPGKDVQVGELAFQTCNDLVICAISCDDLGLLQVWHRQDPTGFECMYSVNFKVEGSSRISLAPDGLTVIIFGNDDNLCYSWNHNTAQFHLVNFNNQVHIPRFFMNFLPISLPKYSPDGKIFAYWSCNDFHVRAWDTRTGQQVSQFQVSPSDGIAIPPLLIGLSHGKKLIVLWQEHRNIIRLFDVYTGHLYAQILGQGKANMTFIKDGTKLAYFSSNFGLRIWDIADLMDEHWHFTHGYELILKEMVAGWVMGRDYEPLFWVPDEHRDNLYVPSPRAVFGIPSKKATSVDLSYSRLGRKWTECIDKEWLRELERKEKEVEDLLEKCVSSSAEVHQGVQLNR